MTATIIRPFHIVLVKSSRSYCTPLAQADFLMGDQDGTNSTTVDTTQQAWEFCSNYSKDVAPILELMTPPPPTTTTEEQEDDTNDGSSASSTYIPAATVQMY